jgi:hypothetical protein
MIRLVGVTALALVVASSAQALPRAPLYQPDGMTMQVARGFAQAQMQAFASQARESGQLVAEAMQK